MVNIESLSPGDEVIIRSDLEAGVRYGGVRVVPQMLRLIGKTAVVREVCMGLEGYTLDHTTVDAVKIYDDEFYCIWTSEMLEPIDKISLMDCLEENNG